MKNIELISIANILKMNFFIPSYQRGYRWKEQQIIDLLNDILEFQKKDKDKGEFYCLQPIVVTKKNIDHWEIIDGQQRLTTIYIILSYLEEARKIMFNSTVKYIISYETREKHDCSSKEFLEKIQDITNISNKNIDFFHFSKAFLLIKDWFEKNEINKADFLNTLLKTDLRDEIDIANNVRFIWYEVETSDRNKAKQIFTRINMGKIPLTNAELIKALFFINLSNTEKEREKYQQKIAYEWDNIEYSLQNKNFWFFINKVDNSKATKIELIFDLIANKYSDSVSIKSNKKIDNYYTFYIFNALINEALKRKEDLWDEIKIYYRTFEEWYNNNEYYHLIGYLIHIGKNIEEIKIISNDNSKSKFKNELIKLIKEDIIKYFTTNQINKLIELSYSDNYYMINRILLLFNVITTMNSKYTRFPFERYINENWSLEHIHAQNSEELKSDTQRRLLLNEQKNFFDKSKNEEYSNNIKEILDNEEIKEEEFVSLQEKIFKSFRMIQIFIQ